MTPDEFRAWRERIGWTQARTADALGVDPRTVREWEHGVGRVTGKPVSLPPMLGLACRWLERCEASERPGVNT